MKRLSLFVLLSVVLTACASASSEKGGCSKSEEVCVKVRVEEPILFGEVVNVSIKVTSEKEIPGLKVFLSSYPKILIEDAQEWKDTGINWPIEAKANQSLTFLRKVRFPPAEGIFEIIAEIYTPSLYAIDSVRIHLTREGGKVYLSGTSIPITDGPLPTENSSQRATRLAYPTSTPYLSLTPPVEMLSPMASQTITPTAPAYPPPATENAPFYLLPGTPAQSPYP
jgi:hypothetical protein